MSPKPDVSTARRSQILDAAAAIFARSGFHESRMEDIAAAAGLSKGTLYLYFDSKDAIVTALLRRLFDHELDDLRQFGTGAAPVGERLLRFTRHIAAEYQRMRADIPLVREFYAVAAREPGVRAFLRGYLRAYRDLLAALIREGIDRGELRPVDAKSAAIAILALYEGLMILWATDSRAVNWETHSEAAIQLLLSGLKRPASGVP